MTEVDWFPGDWSRRSSVCRYDACSSASRYDPDINRITSHHLGLRDIQPPTKNVPLIHQSWGRGAVRIARSKIWVRENEYTSHMSKQAEVKRQACAHRGVAVMVLGTAWLPVWWICLEVSITTKLMPGASGTRGARRTQRQCCTSRHRASRNRSPVRFQPLLSHHDLLRYDFDAGASFRFRSCDAWRLTAVTGARVFAEGHLSTLLARVTLGSDQLARRASPERAR